MLTKCVHAYCPKHYPKFFYDNALHKSILLITCLNEIK